MRTWGPSVTESHGISRTNNILTWTRQTRRHTFPARPCLPILSFKPTLHPFKPTFASARGRNGYRFEKLGLRSVSQLRRNWWKCCTYLFATVFEVNQEISLALVLDRNRFYAPKISTSLGDHEPADGSRAICRFSRLDISTIPSLYIFYSYLES